MSHLEQLPNVTLLALDVTSPTVIQATVEAVKSKTSGALDHLVNKSGASYVMLALDCPIAKVKALGDVGFDPGIRTTSHRYQGQHNQYKLHVKINSCILDNYVRPDWPHGPQVDGARYTQLI